MAQIRWGIIGPGSIAHNFAIGLSDAKNARLFAVSGRSNNRREDFAKKFGAERTYGDYQDLLTDGDVDAVYIATPHPAHIQPAVDALRAGKPVLLEKPAGLNEAEVVAITEVAAQEDIFFMEGLMYRCHPQIARLIELIREGAIGEVRHIRSAFGFAAEFDPNSRLYDPGLAGGGILDVGPYPISFSRLVAGAAAGGAPINPIRVTGTAEMAPSGVDMRAYAHLQFDDGVIAECAAAVGFEMENTAEVIGTDGRIVLANPWTPGRSGGPADTEIRVESDAVVRKEKCPAPKALFAYEAEAASRAISEGQTEMAEPAPSWADSRGTAAVLDAWRKEVGYALPGETPNGLRQISGLMPSSAAIERESIDGVRQPVSRLIMGCDNRETLADGAIVWDAWWEAGGNAFDTGFVYGAGKHEMLLGQWMQSRGVADDAVVIVKGAHSPYCVPDAIEVQLMISLERLGLSRAPIYIMHRDNLDVPVGEFVDVLNDLRNRGFIGALGGSNWTTGRFEEARNFAANGQKHPLTILNNNLSLAVMERPIWPGCISANTPQQLSFLRASGTTHFSWSSQARGYFMEPEERSALPVGTEPDACFSSADNEERRRRVAELAAAMDVPMKHIASAWVLGQSFPSFALIGPRSPGEIVSSLGAQAVKLSPAELEWLNLESDSR